MSIEAPEFTHTASTDWINSEPRNTLPWLKAIHAEYGPKGLKVVSVHTPELPQERDPANVPTAVKELGITYPVMIDGDFSYWPAMKNRYWPAFYLVDRDGKIILSAIGELHRGDKRGDAVEAEIGERLGVRVGSPAR